MSISIYPIMPERSYIQIGKFSVFWRHSKKSAPRRRRPSSSRPTMEKPLGNTTYISNTATSFTSLKSESLLS